MRWLALFLAVLLLSCDGTSERSAPGQTAQAVGPCGAPLDVAYCEKLHDFGYVNVRCPIDNTLAGLPFAAGGVFASADDDCDDTAGIKAALQKAGTTKEVWMPSGTTIGITGCGGSVKSYLVSEPIDVSGRTIRGLGASRDHGARISMLPTAPAFTASATCSAMPLAHIADVPTACKSGAILYAVNAPAKLTALDIRASNKTCGAPPATRRQADYGVFLFNANGSELAGINVWDSRIAAYHLEKSALNLAGDSSLCGDGIGMLLADAPAARLDATAIQVHGATKPTDPTKDPCPDSAASADAHAYVIAARASSGGTYSKVPSRIQLAAVDAEVNGGRAIWVKNVVGPVVVENAWLEGNARGVFAEDSQHFSMVESRSFGTSVGQNALAFRNCLHCTARDNMLHGATSDDFSIPVNGSNRYLDVANNVYWGGSIAGPTDSSSSLNPLHVEFCTDGTCPAWNAKQHQRDDLRGAGPHAHGEWRYGDVVWTSASSGPAGWMCKKPQAAFDFSCDPAVPGEWSALPTLAP